MCARNSNIPEIKFNITDEEQGLLKNVNLNNYFHTLIYGEMQCWESIHGQEEK